MQQIRPIHVPCLVVLGFVDLHLDLLAGNS